MVLTMWSLQVGTDYPKDDEIEMNYHLGSYSNPDMYPYVLILSTKINRNDPKIE